MRINEFRKIAGYKIYRNLLHLYSLTNYEKEKVIKQSRLQLHQKE